MTAFELPYVSLCMLRCGVRSTTSVSLVIGKALSETIESFFLNFVMNVSELPNIPLCVIRCGVRSTMSVSLVVRRFFSGTVGS